MAFDNPHPNRKDWRRSYHDWRDADRTCRPGGTCDHCAAGRKHRARRQTPIADGRAEYLAGVNPED